ncbi:hypothetical protein T07_13715 [Trichinella nelsoni]|uniref:Uncharacterized protein n=1 Tax=Trichinella nelsoni TaxID=6336 RepID=A0A0V0SHZ3_9BILA|nr:hypothetical protein T07_13715 [Trichinella nelsoni]
MSDNYRITANWPPAPRTNRREDPNPGGLLEADGDLDRRLRYRAFPRRESCPLASAAEVVVTESSSSTRRAYRGSAESRRRQLERIEARQKLRTRKAPYDREATFENAELEMDMSDEMTGVTWPLALAYNRAER